MIKKARGQPVKSPHCALTLEPEVGFQPPTFRLRVGCSASTWTAPDGSSLLTLDAPSVQTAPEGSRRIVWMIIGMIKAHPTKNRMPSHAGPERQGSERPRAAARAPRRPDRGWTWQEEPAMALADGDYEIRIKGPPERLPAGHLRGPDEHRAAGGDGAARPGPRTRRRCTGCSSGSSPWAWSWSRSASYRRPGA
jgi:hypothetical protein